MKLKMPMKSDNDGDEMPVKPMKIKIKSQNKGLLHEKLGVAKGKKISVTSLKRAKQSSSPAMRKEATFALNARNWNS